MSALAHAPAPSLMTHCERKRVGPWPDHVTVLWRGALDLLTQELITTAERNGSSVEEVQRALIVDVELKRPWAESGTSVLGPSQFVQDVRRALSRFRGSSYRR
jgi:hypothetical protein